MADQIPMPVKPEWKCASKSIATTQASKKNNPTTRPKAARDALSGRASQQAIPMASNAAPAIRPTTGTEGLVLLAPRRREVASEGIASSARPAPTSSTALTVNSVLVVAPFKCYRLYGTRPLGTPNHDSKSWL
jgi:hypothetical protein